MSARYTSRQMIERLIGFDTTSRLSNLELIGWVRDYLAGHGVESRLVFDATGTKANLFATLGPPERPGIVLSGHTDVVPVDGQDWHTEPFRAVERDGRLYGRGTCDMKSYLGVALALVPEFLARGLGTPIHLALSYDEEVGCIGVRRLIADLAERGVRPVCCIVGEPTEMRVVVGHKGKLSMRCHVRGHECHSALAHLGVNAIEAAAEAIAFLNRLARRQRDEGPHDRLFEPPYTTIQTGLIRGGTALNIVAGECSFDFELRHLPGVDPRALLAELVDHCDQVLAPPMRAVAPDAGFRFEELTAFPGLDLPEDAEVAQLAKALSGANATGKVAFGTEAGLFQQAGVPTVVCGPGSIEQAHKPDEFIALEQIALCEGFMRRLMDRVCVD